MTWLKLDDGFLRHPKFINAMGRHAHALYTWLGLLSWSKQNLTDGLVPAAAVRVTDGPSNGKQRALAVQALVNAKLVHREPNGDLRLHDFLDWNDPSELVKVRRREDRKRKLQGGRPVSDTPIDSALTPRVTPDSGAVDYFSTPAISPSCAPIPAGFRSSETKTETETLKTKREDTSSSPSAPVDPRSLSDDSGEPESGAKTSNGPAEPTACPPDASAAVEAGAGALGADGRRSVSVKAVATKSLAQHAGAAASTEVLEVFEHWKRVMSKAPSTELSPKRLRAVRARLDGGRTAKELCRAIDGCARSDFNMGRESGRPTKYNDLELICRDAEHLERFLDLAESPQKFAAASRAPASPPKGRPALEVMAEWEALEKAEEIKQVAERKEREARRLLWQQRQTGGES